MAEGRPPQEPVRIGDEWVFFLEGEAIIPPPGTMPPSRPPGKERNPAPPGTMPGWECAEFTGPAEIPPPGTMPPPRPPGKERNPVFRVAVPGTEPAAVQVVAELVKRVQGVVNGLTTDPAGLDALRQATASLPRAG